MIVGHFFLAFALTGLIGYYIGLEKEETMKLAVAASLFALIPDLDVIYSIGEISTLFNSGFYGFTESFWEASETIHRGLTHSLITLSIATLAFITYHRRPSKKTALSIVIGGTLTAIYLDGLLTGLIIGAFSLSGITITHNLTSSSSKNVLISLLTGLMIHPFGDILTGTPPDFLHPLTLKIIQKKLMLSPDSVINFFAVLGIEITTIWLAIYTYSLIKSKNIIKQIKPLSGIGAAYILTAGIIEKPTLSTSYQFVFSMIFIAFIASLTVKKIHDTPIDKYMLSINFLTAMSLASIVYLIQYLI